MLQSHKFLLLRPLFWKVMEDKDLRVKFVGLKDGEHTFDFVVGQAFFTSCESDLLKEGEVRIDILFNKKPTHFELTFTLKGWVSSICDRCLVDYHQSIDSNFNLFVKLGDVFEEVSDEMVIIPRSEFEMDMTQWIYEFILVSIPMRKVACEILDDYNICDEVVRSRTEELIREKVNPMWDALKGLNKN